MANNNLLMMEGLCLSRPILKLNKRLQHKKRSGKEISSAWDGELEKSLEIQLINVTPPT